jgi:uncharacterized protein (DUF2252 family)
MAATPQGLPQPPDEAGELDMTAHARTTSSATATRHHPTNVIPMRVEHPSREQRVARGKAARAAVPRSRQAELDLSNRMDPLGLIQEQVEDRIPGLVPIRYGRMVESPLAFYRGSAVVMAADLSRTPSSGLTAQICGDLHLANFGMFATPERNHIFDVTDFDETLPGPWEWDLKRLAASFELAGRADGFSAANRQEVVIEVARSYRTAMLAFEKQRNLDVWYTRLDIDTALAEYEKRLSRKELKRKRAAVTKALARDSEQVFERWTRLASGDPHIVSEPPRVVPIDELLGPTERKRFENTIRNMFREYRASLPNYRRELLQQFRLVDFARKVVGVGSVGTRCWTALLLGVDKTDALFLQIKEAQSSVLERFLGPSRYLNHGQRVVAGQRMMQSSSDIFLGWGRGVVISGAPRDYYFRQLRDWKGSFVIKDMTPSSMTVYARICGWTLARAHARSGDRVAIAAYMGKAGAFDEALAKFAKSYADVTERDYGMLVRAVRAGRVKAQTGV